MFSTRLLPIAAMVMAMLPTGSFAVEKVNLSSSLEPLACSQPGALCLSGQSCVAIADGPRQVCRVD